MAPTINNDQERGLNRSSETPERGSPLEQSAGLDKTPTGSVLSRKLRKLVDSSLETDAETQEALKELSTFFGENTLKNRRQLRGEIERRSLEINSDFLDGFRQVKDALDQSHSRLIGPNCPGIISPGENFKMGIMPGHIHLAGRTGVVSRSGTLTYEAVGQLTDLNIGQSTCVGIGGDPVSGVTFVDMLEKFQNDPETDNVVMIGEIGGTKEQEAAEYIKSDFTKPIAALIVGQSAPPGKRMGHAGAIITGSAGKAEEKMKALSNAGVSVIPGPGAIGKTLQELISYCLLYTSAAAAE